MKGHLTAINKLLRAKLVLAPKTNFAVSRNVPDVSNRINNIYEKDNIA